MSRGIALNNPGCIRNGTQWLGLSADQPDPLFCKFTDAKYGIRAIAKILGAYAKRGITSVRDVISSWSPPSENKTDAYVAAVCDECKWTPETVIDSSLFLPLIRAIIRHENGEQPYSDEEIEAGIALAGEPMPKDVTQSRSNMLTVTMGSALVIPVVQKATGITLTTDQALTLMAAVVAAWHFAVAAVERYFPPPQQ